MNLNQIQHLNAPGAFSFILFPLFGTPETRVNEIGRSTINFLSILFFSFLDSDFRYPFPPQRRFYSLTPVQKALNMDIESLRQILSRETEEQKLINEIKIAREKQIEVYEAQLADEPPKKCSHNRRVKFNETLLGPTRSSIPARTILKRAQMPLSTEQDL